MKYLLAQNVPTYSYILTFEGQHSFTELFGIEKQGVCHADDLLYLFAPVFGNVIDFTLTNQSDVDLREEMTKAWTNFAKFGNPTPSGSGNNWNNWTPVDQSNPAKFWDISGKISSMSDDTRFAERMAFWDSLNLS